jgi:uncharacterized membrane protein
MKGNLSLKAWISPGLAVVYIIISITGVLMFLHVKNGIIVQLHEWLGFLFIGVGIIHLLINWKLFLSVLKKKSAIISICLVSIVSLMIAFTSENKPRDRPLHKSQAIYLDEANAGRLP